MGTAERLKDVIVEQSLNIDMVRSVVELVDGAENEGEGKVTKSHISNALNEIFNIDRKSNNKIPFHLRYRAFSKDFSFSHSSHEKMKI